MSDDNVSLAELRGRLNKLKATQASLQADVLRLQGLPSSSQVRHAERTVKKDLTPYIEQLVNIAAEVEERCILYRTAGWTVFEMDLDIGKRDRAARKEKSISRGGKRGLGLGIRLETFYNGRFHQPFYLIFAKQTQLLQIQASSSTNVQSHARLRLLRHTIPYFVPLGDILRAYLHPQDGEEYRDDETMGGLDLMPELKSNEGLSLFLSQLHTYLQCFISRREQVLALQTPQLPGYLHSALRAFGSDSFGQLMIRWELPCPSAKDLQAFKDRDEIFYYSTDTPDSIHSNSKTEGQVNAQLEVHIVYHDLSGDCVGEVAEEVSSRRKMVESLGGQETPGLRCKYATILVESVHSRIPPARRGDSKKHENLQIRRRRRQDWEMLFTDPSSDLQKTLASVMDLAWREELQRVIAEI